jgi:hypothetical protein
VKNGRDVRERERERDEKLTQFRCDAESVAAASSRLSATKTKQHHAGHDRQRTIVITSVEKTATKISYRFSYTADIAGFFLKNPIFFIEYDCEHLGVDIDLRNVPDSILVIPLLCNLLPLVWYFDLTIEVPDIDKAFYECLDAVRAGFIKMYPRATFGGQVITGQITDNSRPDITPGRNISFFSGGVDGTATFINHVSEKPVLMSIWGADVPLKDVHGWSRVRERIAKSAEQFGTNCCSVKTSIRGFLNEFELSRRSEKYVGDWWWYALQHGLGFIGHSIPIAYIFHSQHVYMASTFSAQQYEQYHVVCASSPCIDGNVRWADTKVVHDAIELSRIEKVQKIVSFVHENHLNIALRVCWEITGGMNCCACEKCARTTLELLAVSANPNDFGFRYNPKQVRQLRLETGLVPLAAEHTYWFWEEIQTYYQQHPEITEAHPELRWFVSMDLKPSKKLLLWKRFYLSCRMVGRWLLRCFPL